MKQRRLVATGMGLISPIGHTPGDFWKNLLEERSGAASARRFDGMPSRSSVAALVNGFDPQKYIGVRAGRRMNRLSQMAVAASKMALAEAGGFRGGKIGVCLGTGFGCLDTTEIYLKRLFDDDAPYADAFEFSEAVANAPAGHVAIELGCHGSNSTVTHHEGSAGIAAVQSALALLRDHSGAMICGGFEEVNRHLYNALDKVGALNCCDTPAGPFDATRSGLIPGEGAGAFFLESLERAAARQAPGYGELIGFAMANDTEAPMSDWSDSSESYARTMSAALQASQLPPDDVDVVVASANGSRKLDAREAEAIENTFGKRAILVTSVKGHVGEFAGAGVFSILAALLMLRHQVVFPIARLRTPEKHHAAKYVMESRPASVRHVIVNFFSSGGSCTCLVFKRIC